jgi:S-formylglutathione hydrolase
LGESCAASTIVDKQTRMLSTIDIKANTRVCGGRLIRFSHSSNSTQTVMTLSVFLPNDVERSDATAALPCLVYLSGLTCTDENVCQKSGIFKQLSKHKVIFC